MINIKFLTKTHMKENMLARQSPFVYFWLGVLTGALLIIASFMVKSLANDGTASLLNIFKTPAAQVQNAGAAKGINDPDTRVGINDPDTKVSIKSTATSAIRR